MDYYALLNVDVSATQAEIKAAYHRALLAAHPDKNASSTTDIAALKEAYRALSSPEFKKHGPRPAQIVSLSEFTEHPEDETWDHPCRCGARYTITVSDMDTGRHLVPCSSCSEVVWVGYEVLDE
ncbi:hypothetical protein MIND_00028800 [Mycena indigotica]|uniref:Diphthamide biosynthesis protein 4 n=1 Tax=Mycena indigotica TaxID=2126181 RepID=A0A8H6WJZ9_9AGAR|nr:uncharacterized protein MIND_00028800 [Mycena indigotica]KAF7315144.1 hypothetical protein MIND_00028800 [Mycena indigotica]